MGLKWKKFTSEEKLKMMDKMIAYVKKTAEAVDDKYSRDIYEQCKVIACTDFVNFMKEHVQED